MKTYKTLLGELTVTDARIKRASGYGQYKIVVDYIFEGKPGEFKIHSTDSQLFDQADGEDDHTDIVLKGAESIIEKEVDNYVSSL